MNYPYIKITIEEFSAPKDESNRYPERIELMTQIINREWFMEYEMLKGIVAVVYGLQAPSPDLSAIARAMRRENHD